MALIRLLAVSICLLAGVGGVFGMVTGEDRQAAAIGLWSLLASVGGLVLVDVAMNVAKIAKNTDRFARRYLDGDVKEPPGAELPTFVRWILERISG